MGNTKPRTPFRSVLSVMLAVLMLLSIFPAAVSAQAVSKPAQVQNLKAAQVTHNAVKLTWSAVSGKGNYYMVFSYNAKTKKYTSLATTTAATCSVMNLSPKTSYTFAVQAFRKSGSAKYWGKVSEKLTVKTRSLTLAKPVITSVKSGYGAISIAWNKVKNAENYRVYRREMSEKSYSKLADTKSLKYTDKTVIPGRVYYYRIRAFVKTAKGIISSENSGYKKAYTNYPATVTGVKAVNSKTYLKITWNKVIGADGYQVYRSTTGQSGSYKKVAMVKTNAYNDKNVKGTNIYYYLIRAYRSADKKVYYGKFSARVFGTLSKNPPVAVTDGGIPLYPITSSTAKTIANSSIITAINNGFEGRSADGKSIVVYGENSLGWIGQDINEAFYDTYGKKQYCEHCGKVNGTGNNMCNGQCVMSFS